MKRMWRNAALFAVLVALVIALSATVAGTAGPPGLGTTPATPGSVGALSVPAQPLLVGTWAIERPMVTGAGDQHYGAAYGNYVVYEDLVPDADVKLYNRLTNQTVPISVHAGSLQWRPRMWGNRIVWMDNRNGNWDIYWCDIRDKVEHRLTTDLTDQAWPEIQGDRVVWQDSRWGPPEIVMYDFVARRETRITTDSFVQYEPRIYGNRVAWGDGRNGNWDIYWYDIAKKQESQLTSSPADEYYVDLWGNRAVWQVNNAGDIYWAVASYFDANTIARNYYNPVGNTYRPRLYKDTVIYVDESSGRPQIGLYRFGTLSIADVTNSPANAYEPVMWGENVVWFDTRSGDRDIYGARVFSPSLSLAAPTAVSYNTATTVTGYLKNWDGTVMASRTVWPQYQSYGQHGSFSFANVGNATTNSTGKFTAVIPAQQRNFWARAYYDGDNDAFRQLSDQRTVYVKPYLTTPSGPTSILRTKTFASAGYLKPRHVAGTKPVRIQCYRKESGVWKLRLTYYATVSDYSTYSRYAATVKLPYAGYWRIRAYYPTSATNYKNYSAYRYVISK